MESVIKWQTGETKEEGEYIVQLKYYNRLTISSWERFSNGWNWTVFSKSEIIAWCKLSDIEPYKDETNK